MCVDICGQLCACMSVSILCLIFLLHAFNFLSFFLFFFSGCSQIQFSPFCYKVWIWAWNSCPGLMLVVSKNVNITNSIIKQAKGLTGAISISYNVSLVDTYSYWSILVLLIGIKSRDLSKVSKNFKYNYQPIPNTKPEYVCT